MSLNYLCHHSLDPKCWNYLSEGGDAIVLSFNPLVEKYVISLNPSINTHQSTSDENYQNCEMNRVQSENCSGLCTQDLEGYCLRVSKKKIRDAGNYSKTIKSDNCNTQSIDILSHITYSKAFTKYIPSSVMFKTELVSIPYYFLYEVLNQVDSSRPENRRKNWNISKLSSPLSICSENNINYVEATLIEDARFLTPLHQQENGITNDKLPSPSITFELKPKWGFISQDNYLFLPKPHDTTITSTVTCRSCCSYFFKSKPIASNLLHIGCMCPKTCFSDNQYNSIKNSDKNTNSTSESECILNYPYLFSPSSYYKTDNNCDSSNPSKIHPPPHWCVMDLFSHTPDVLLSQKLEKLLKNQVNATNYAKNVTKLLLPRKQVKNYISALLNHDCTYMFNRTRPTKHNPSSPLETSFDLFSFSSLPSSIIHNQNNHPTFEKSNDVYINSTINENNVKTENILTIDKIEEKTNNDTINNTHTFGTHSIFNTNNDNDSEIEQNQAINHDINHYSNRNLKHVLATLFHNPQNNLKISINSNTYRNTEKNHSYIEKNTKTCCTPGNEDDESVVPVIGRYSVCELTNILFHTLKSSQVSLILLLLASSQAITHLLGPIDTNTIPHTYSNSNNNITDLDISITESKSDNNSNSTESNSSNSDNNSNSTESNSDSNSNSTDSNSSNSDSNSNSSDSNSDSNSNSTYSNSNSTDSKSNSTNTNTNNTHYFNTDNTYSSNCYCEHKGIVDVSLWNSICEHTDNILQYYISLMKLKTKLKPHQCNQLPEDVQLLHDFSISKPYVYILKPYYPHTDSHSPSFISKTTFSSSSLPHLPSHFPSRNHDQSNLFENNPEMYIRVCISCAYRVIYTMSVALKDVSVYFTLQPLVSHHIPDNDSSCQTLLPSPVIPLRSTFFGLTHTGTLSESKEMDKDIDRDTDVQCMKSMITPNTFQKEHNTTLTQPYPIVEGKNNDLCIDKYSDDILNSNDILNYLQNLYNQTTYPDSTFDISIPNITSHSENISMSPIAPCITYRCSIKIGDIGPKDLRKYDKYIVKEQKISQASPK